MICRNRFDQLVAEFKREDESGGYDQQRAEWWAHVTFAIIPECIETLTDEEALRLYKNRGG